ncbi:substrate-binding domain-containing protein [Novispirillum sp. DQ9]|uniref:substrate-binding domain-containing protein n=1 Tax=Novispirillum sp. DQ9 TaxID=3398612 RepID=UPI003C7C4B62
MKRRDFLLTAGAGLACAAGGFGWARAAAPGTGATAAALEAIARSRCLEGQLPVIPTTAASDLIISGSRLLKEGFLAPFAIAFQRETGLRVTILGGGCDDGIEPVANGRAHLGAVCCGEVWGLRQGVLKQTVVARDLKVVLVHPDNPLDGLDMETLRAVARGRVTDWGELAGAPGGARHPLAFVAFEHCADYREPVREALLDARGAWPSLALRAKTDEEALGLVARFPGAIGINSWVIAAPLVAAGRLKVLALDGVRPGLDGPPPADYPLTGPFALLHRDWRPAVMAPFFDALAGATGQAAMAARLLPVERRA